jgi:hypothetical protein
MHGQGGARALTAVRGDYGRGKCAKCGPRLVNRKSVAAPEEHSFLALLLHFGKKYSMIVQPPIATASLRPKRTRIAAFMWAPSLLNLIE